MVPDPRHEPASTVSPSLSQQHAGGARRPAIRPDCALDACRDSPFGRIVRGMTGQASLGGLKLKTPDVVDAGNWAACQSKLRSSLLNPPASCKEAPGPT